MSPPEAPALCQEPPSSTSTLIPCPCSKRPEPDSERAGASGPRVHSITHSSVWDSASVRSRLPAAPGNPSSLASYLLPPGRPETALLNPLSDPVPLLSPDLCGSGDRPPIASHYSINSDFFKKLFLRDPMPLSPPPKASSDHPTPSNLVPQSRAPRGWLLTRPGTEPATERSGQGMSPKTRERNGIQGAQSQPRRGLGLLSSEF